MTTLIDRYVWAVLRAAPSAQRTELEPEVRGLVSDAVEARIASGDPAKDAERAALAELGDPTVLAARYTDQSLHLIGPALFPAWRRLLSVLLPILVPLIAVIVLAAQLAGGATVGQAIVAAGGAAVSVGIQTTFWVTLVFAIMERTTGPETVAAGAWSVDDLPELPDDGRMGVAEFVATIIVQVIVLGGLMWVQFQPPIVIEGEAFPLFDPALWSFWLPWFIVVLVAEIVMAVGIFLRGRWTIPFAIANAVLGAAFAIPAVYLIQNDLLLNPELVAAITASTGSTWLSVTGTITMVVIVAITVWDAIDGFRKARRASTARAGTGTAAATS
jgi:hypothetical protein